MSSEVCEHDMIKPPPTVTSDLAQRADAELCALAARVRPDWDIGALWGALAAAGSSPEWSVARTLTKVTAMLTDDRAQPFELLDAVQQTPPARVLRPEPVDAETRWELLAPARAAVAAASLTWAERQRERDPDETAGTVPGDDR